MSYIFLVHNIICAGQWDHRLIYRVQEEGDEEEEEEEEEDDEEDEEEEEEEEDLNLPRPPYYPSRPVRSSPDL